MAQDNRSRQIKYAAALVVAGFLGWMTHQASLEVTFTFVVRVLMILFVLIIGVKFIMAITKTLGLSKASKEGY